MDHKSSISGIKIWLGFLLFSCLLLYPFFLGQTVVAADTIKSIPFWKFGSDFLFSKGHLVQWIPHIFGGMPAWSPVMVTPSYLPSTLIAWFGSRFIPVLFDPLVLHILHLSVLGWGTTLYLQKRGMRWGVAALAGCGLMLSTTLFGLIGAGHTIKLWTVCLMPVTLYTLEELLQHSKLKTLSVFALTLALLMSVKHVQMTWYFLIFAGVYTLVRAFQIHLTDRPQLLRTLAMALGGVLLALLLMSFFYLPVLEYSSLSIRGAANAAVDSGSYAAAYSYPPGDLISWIFSGARGYGGGDYWGDLEYTAFPLYMGILWLPFVVLAFFLPASRKQAFAWLLPAVLLAILGFGSHSPFFNLLVDYLPYYGKFRAHMWAFAIVQLLIVYIAAGGLEAWLKSGESLSQRLPKPALPMVGAAVFLLGILLLVNSPQKASDMGQGDSYFRNIDQQNISAYFARQGVTASGAQLQSIKQDMRMKRAQHWHTSAGKSLILLGIIVLLCVLVLKGKIQQHHLLLALALLLLIDLAPQGYKALRFDKFREPKAWFRPGGAMSALLKLEKPHEFRIWTRDQYGHNDSAWYGLHDISGYHGAKLASIGKLQETGQIQEGQRMRYHPTVLDMLNVRYVISDSPMQDMVKRGQAEDGLLLENQDALPRLSFPADIQTVSADQQLQALMRDGFDPHETVLLAEFPESLKGSSLAEAQGEIVFYEPERIEYHIKSQGAALALLSEIWVPKGWVATLDGTEVPVLLADHLLRAVAIPTAGNHKLVLEYHAPGWRLGVLLSTLSLFFCLGLLILSRFREKLSNNAASQALVGK